VEDKIMAIATRLSTFDCKQINLISIGEIVLAFLVCELDVP
jgi:hypothetical protein